MDHLVGGTAQDGNLDAAQPLGLRSVDDGGVGGNEGTECGKHSEPFGLLGPSTGGLASPSFLGPEAVPGGGLEPAGGQGELVVGSVVKVRVELEASAVVGVFIVAAPLLFFIVLLLVVLLLFHATALQAQVEVGGQTGNVEGGPAKVVGVDGETGPNLDQMRHNVGGGTVPQGQVEGVGHFAAAAAAAGALVEIQHEDLLPPDPGLQISAQDVPPPPFDEVVDRRGPVLDLVDEFGQLGSDVVVFGFVVDLIAMGIAFTICALGRRLGGRGGGGGVGRVDRGAQGDMRDCRRGEVTPA